MKIKITHLFSSIVFAFVILVNLTPAQTNLKQNEDVIPLPSEEEFSEADALAVPWRNSGCHDYREYRDPNCEWIIGEKFLNSHNLTLYDDNGSVWFHFSVSIKSPNHFYEKKKLGFLPFATAWDDYRPSLVLLRLVGESNHWYKVEVNEETQATKFILKTDPMWAKTSWSYWLFHSKTIRVDFEKTPLYDKPNGQILDESPKGGEFVYAWMQREVEGEWAFVKTVILPEREERKGWIKWRDGRKILVKLTFDVTNGLSSK